MSQQQLETLFEFPCRFPIKIVGEPSSNLKVIVAEALDKVGVKNNVELSTRESSGGKFQSVTGIFEAASKQQLDELYKILSDNPEVKFVL